MNYNHRYELFPQYIKVSREPPGYRTHDQNMYPKLNNVNDNSHFWNSDYQSFNFFSYPYLFNTCNQELMNPFQNNQNQQGFNLNTHNSHGHFSKLKADYKPEPFFSQNEAYFNNNCQVNRQVSSYCSVPPMSQLTSSPKSLMSFDQQVQIHRRTRSLSLCSNNSMQYASLKKTKICDHWRANGSCSYGTSCWYAHGENDLRKTADPQHSPRGSSSIDSKSIVIGGVASAEGNMKHKSLNVKSECTAKMKRVSTNVKGLTVDIPPSIATKERNSSMPLSPAQERWISMSLGEKHTGNNVSGLSSSVSFSPKSEGSSSSTNTVTAISSTSTLITLSDVKDNKNHNREDFEIADYNETENNKYSTNLPDSEAKTRKNDYHIDRENNQYQALIGNYEPISNPFLHRSFNKKPHTRGNIFTDFEIPQESIGNMSRSSSGRNYSDMLQQQQNQMNGNIFSSNNGIMRTTNVYQQQLSQNQPCPMLVDEIYKRQKIMESGGHLDTMGVASNNFYSKINEFKCHHFNSSQQIIYNENNRRRQQADFTSNLDPNRLESVPYSNRQHLNREMMINGRSYVSPANMFLKSQLSGSHISSTTSTDCQCRIFRGKTLRCLPTNFQHSLSTNSTFHSQMNNQTEIPIAPLAPPPKISRTLLPNDKSFSIWLDTNPEKKKKSNSATSLLSKIDDFGFNLNVMNTETNDPKSEEFQNDETSPLNVKSLCELLSNEQLIKKKPKTKINSTENKNQEKVDEDIFNFNLLQMSYKKNEQTEKEVKDLFVIAEKTPTCENKEEKIQTLKPDYETCYFFSIGGSCPFGDSCALSHSVDHSINHSTKNR